MVILAADTLIDFQVATRVHIHADQGVATNPAEVLDKFQILPLSLLRIGECCTRSTDNWAVGGDSALFGDVVAEVIR